jgi:hypothetical protein
MLMNAEQAAKVVNKNPRLLRQWAAEGKVQGVFKVGAAWVAPLEAWESAASEVRKPGPKPKGK